LKISNGGDMFLHHLFLGWSWRRKEARAQRPDVLEAGALFAQRPDMLEAGACLLVAQRPDVLEAGACGVVCPEARHAGGWGFLGLETFWRFASEFS
jgi:hypothetical protein